MLLFLYFFTQILVLNSGQNPPIVNTKCGKIQGFNALSSNGTSFSAFLNIPFGIPPVGDLRFTYPQPFGKWSGIRNGYQQGNICSQFFIGDEDCLNLNVYVSQYPANVNNGNLPVLVYIPPGAFVFGPNSYYIFGPANFMDFPVILVILNYRLGPYGFLSTNDSSAYGNFAMLDTILALQWVQENIQSFGGDPSKVTIFGDSSGSAMAVHLVLSQLSKGLFSGAIDEGGSALMPWAVVPIPLEMAQTLSKRLNCPFENSKDLVNCLRKRTALEIEFASLGLYFGPVVEAPGGPGFLTEMPIDVILNNKIGNKVPVLIESTELEGYSFGVPRIAKLLSFFNFNSREIFRNIFVNFISLIIGIGPYIMADVFDAIENFYDLKNLDLDNETTFIQTLSAIFGDVSLAVPNSQTANLLSQAGLPVYASIYTHINLICFSTLIGEKCGRHSSHGDQPLIEFNLLGIPTLLDSDRHMSKVLISLYVAFANQSDLYLSPGVLWPLYNTTDPQYAILNNQPTIGFGILSNATELWTVTIPELVKDKYPK